MFEGFQVIAVADLAGRKWALQGALPTQPNTKIHKMLRLGDTVEVFAIPTTSAGQQPPDRGLHETLLPPTVAIVIECALTTAWQAAQASFSESPERIDIVHDVTGRTWERGKAVPVDASMVIERIEAHHDRVECFARPGENTEWARNHVAFLFTLMPFTVPSVIASAPMVVWSEILKDREEEARLGDDDGEPDPEPEPEPEPVMAPGPTASPLEGLMPSSILPTNPNGA